ncbi:AcrVA2 family anti-CRISPR protein [Solimonas flava]|uniref:AcrVA2 family anti-CRISPR protein n=1 Tax=Solimonas flava TaxID=415849 RepID=UPI0003F9FB21|nr:hypothetical protein [Solimonas flava]
MTQFQRRTHRARRLLESAGSFYPQAWQQFDAFRRDRGAAADFDWPDWCYMPIAAGYAIASGGGRLSLDRASHPAIITALATWRMTQGIYRYDATLRDEVLRTPLDGDLPTAHLYRLPEWCVYIETDPETTRWSERPLHGFFVHLEYDIARNGMPELRLLLDCADDPRQPFADDSLVPIPLIITAPDLQTAIGMTVASGSRQAAQLGIQLGAAADDVATQTAPTIAPLVSLLLYLCADPDITRRGTPAVPSNPQPVRTRRDGWRLFPADGPAEWDVGVRLGAALRAAAARGSAGGDETGRQVRAHVRRAHWHTILSGPRLRDDKTEIPAAQRRRDLRWLPPTPVNVDDYNAMPAVVRPVKS